MLMKFTKKHEQMLEKAGKTLREIQLMEEDEASEFMKKYLLPYVCGGGTKEEEDIAEDLITMITVWDIGEEEKEYMWENEY